MGQLNISYNPATTTFFAFAFSLTLVATEQTFEEVPLERSFSSDSAPGENRRDPPLPGIRNGVPG
jgi:hypothetical protein